MGLILNRKHNWLTQSVSRCSSYSKRLLPTSAWHLCCMISSQCHLPRLLPSSGARLSQHANLPVVPVAGFKEQPRHPRPHLPANEKSLTHSWLHRVVVISRHCWPYSIRMSCFELIRQ